MKTALHSVSYAGLWPGQARLGLEAFIDKAADLGFEGIMLMAKRPHASVLDLDADDRKKIRERLAERRLFLSCLAGYNNLTMDMEHPDVPALEIQITYIVKLAELARDLGGNMVRVFTAFENAVFPFQMQWERCVQGLKEASKRCADLGVTLAVQNHHDMAVHYESLFDLLQEVNEKNCRAAFDAWAVVLQGDNLSEAVKKMAPFIVHTTVADYVRRRRFSYQIPLVNYVRKEDVIKAVPVGEGIIDYRVFFNALKDAGYDGYVAYEMCSPLAGGGSEKNLDFCASKFLKFMKTVEENVC